MFAVGLAGDVAAIVVCAYDVFVSCVVCVVFNLPSRSACGLVLLGRILATVKARDGQRASPQVQVAPRGLLELEHRVLQQLATLLDSCMSPMRDACRPAVGSWRQRRLTGKAELATVCVCGEDLLATRF